MTSDCYAILGVTPAAEDVVIGAAYRALMRHYHPDTNPDPDAQARAQAITAAYAVLRDPARRADYDAQRAANDDLWFAAEPPPAEPPAMRTAGIALALLAIAMVGAVWAWPQTDQPRPRQIPPSAAKNVPPKPVPARTEPVIELAPESERLASLRGDSSVRPPSIPVTPPPDESAPVLDPPNIVPTASIEPVKGRPLIPKRAAAPTAHGLAKPAVVTKPVAEPATAPSSDRLATLDRISTGFFSQSMVHADDARKELLVGARDRFAGLRKACRSESCVADSYLRQIRETSAIMEARPAPPK